jgi:prepilin-type N-terminal cleavage/methylation domain-containing protein
MNYTVRGFTLIELSIALVIIGLIVGGVLVGQDMIKAAAVRAQVTQIEKFNQAANAFKGKYGYLPGDIPNPFAAQFGFKTRGPYKGEGDGNGIIESNCCNNPYGLADYYTMQGEEAMFWVDLSTANMIEGSFSTATPTAVITATIPASGVGQYFPAAKIGYGGYIYVWSNGWNGYEDNQYDGNNYFAVTAVTGSPSNNVGFPYSMPLMTPAQAYAIDKKMDDGLPQYGNVIAFDLFMGWASGGPISSLSGVFYENYGGDCDPVNCGPVVAGDGEQTPLSTSQPANTTCFDNKNVAGATENYSLTNSTMVNCSLSFRFQ